jgi:hypothetical protein
MPDEMPPEVIRKTPYIPDEIINAFIPERRQPKQPRSWKVPTWFMVLVLLSPLLPWFVALYWVSWQEKYRTYNPSEVVDQYVQLKGRDITIRGAIVRIDDRQVGGPGSWEIELAEIGRTDKRIRFRSFSRDEVKGLSKGRIVTLNSACVTTSGIQVNSPELGPMYWWVNILPGSIARD